MSSARWARKESKVSHSPDNVGNRKQVEAARKKIRLNTEAEAKDLETVLNTKEGRSLLWRLLGQFKVFESVFEPNSRISYNAGIQDAGHFILAQIMDVRPDAWLQMMQEAKEKETA